jgi:hypothetical protein
MLRIGQRLRTVIAFSSMQRRRLPSDFLTKSICDANSEVDGRICLRVSKVLSVVWSCYIGVIRFVIFVLFASGGRT